MEILVRSSSGHWQQLLEAGINITGNLHEGPIGVNTLHLARSSVLEIVTSDDIFLSHHHTLKINWFSFEFLDCIFQCNT